MFQYTIRAQINNTMANKSLGVAVILVLLLLLHKPLMVVAAVEDDDDKDVGKNADDIKNGEVNMPIDCKEQCIAICMKIKYAKDSLCQDACDPACKQLQGKGSMLSKK